ncbi:MAG TPA: transposase [Ureibacillus sp.]|nr:transposase [Ureibacillus sp.]
MGRQYDQEFKDYVSKLVVEEGRKAAELSKEMKVSPQSIGRWVKEYKDRTNKSEANKYVSSREVEKLKMEFEKELAKLKEENEILKKAKNFFNNG